MNRLKGTCLRERIEICTYRVTWMQGSWTVSLYRIIHTNAFIWISKHWNSIALLYTSRLVSLSVFCFVLTPPNPSVVREARFSDGALSCPAFLRQTQQPRRGFWREFHLNRGASSTLEFIYPSFCAAC